MAFNFLGGQQSYDPFSPYQQSFYNDPRRRGAQGSFNPYALSNFAATSAKGGAQPAPAETKAPQPLVKSPIPSTSFPPSAGSRPVPGTPPPSTPGYQGGGTPVDKPGAPSPNSGAFDYAAYPTLQALYAAHPGGLPVGFDMDAWAQATGNQSVMNQSTSGDPLRFTWNPNEPGFINPQTGETYDKPGETYPYTPPPPPAPTWQPSSGVNLPAILSRFSGGRFPLGR